MFPYVKEGETFQGPPVVIQFHEGDWHQGARLYRDWFSSTFQLADTGKNWMCDEMAFQGHCHVKCSNLDLVISV